MPMTNFERDFSRMFPACARVERAVTRRNNISAQFGGHPDKQADILADAIGRQEFFEQRVESLIDEHAAQVEGYIKAGNEYEGVSVLSLLGNTCPTEKLTVHQIDKQIKDCLLVVIFHQDAEGFIPAAQKLGELLKQQVPLQAREAVKLHENRLMQQLREAS